MHFTGQTWGAEVKSQAPVPTAGSGGATSQQSSSETYTLGYDPTAKATPLPAGPSSLTWVCGGSEPPSHSGPVAFLGPSTVTRSWPHFMVPGHHPMLAPAEVWIGCHFHPLIPSIFMPQPLPSGRFLDTTHSTFPCTLRKTHRPPNPGKELQALKPPWSPLPGVGSAHRDCC